MTARRNRCDDELEALLRAAFESEIEAQGDRVPGREFILLMARISEHNRRQSKLAAIQAWSEILVVGAFAALLAFWWNDATSGLEAIRPLAQTNFSWPALLGVSAGLVALLLLWPMSLIRDS